MLNVQALHSAFPHSFSKYFAKRGGITPHVKLHFLKSSHTSFHLTFKFALLMPCHWFSVGGNLSQEAKSKQESTVLPPRAAFLRVNKCGVPSWQPWHAEPGSCHCPDSRRGSSPGFVSACPRRIPVPGARDVPPLFRLWHLAGIAGAGGAGNRLWAQGAGGTCCSLGTGMSPQFMPGVPLNTHRAPRR